MNFNTLKSPIPALLDDIRNGEMVVLVDDERRENEGDLILAAQMVTPKAINFMATHGRGLICLAMTEEQAARLDLKLMEKTNQQRHETAFTVSIEAREGVTTGISAPDRARTIAAAISADATPEQIATPGHVFPIVARKGGVLVRAGHTEAAIDLARLAGLHPSGVICEIMKEDGTMARRDDLLGFVRTHNLKIGTIAELIAWRLMDESIVKKITETDFTSRHGRFRLSLYRDSIHHLDHMAFVKGRIEKEKAPLVRMHSVDLLQDIAGGNGLRPALPLVAGAMRMIENHGSGVLVLLRNTNDLVFRTNGEDSDRSVHDETPGDTKNQAEISPFDTVRYYGIGAQILRDLGIKTMTLLAKNPKHIVGLEGFGLSIAGYREIPVREQEQIL